MAAYLQGGCSKVLHCRNCARNNANPECFVSVQVSLRASFLQILNNEYPEVHGKKSTYTIFSLTPRCFRGLAQTSDWLDENSRWGNILWPRILCIQVYILWVDFAPQLCFSSKWFPLSKVGMRAWWRARTKVNIYITYLCPKVKRSDNWCVGLTSFLLRKTIRTKHNFETILENITKSFILFFFWLLFMFVYHFLSVLHVGLVCCWRAGGLYFTHSSTMASSQNKGRLCNVMHGSW